MAIEIICRDYSEFGNFGDIEEYCITKAKYLVESISNLDTCTDMELCWIEDGEECCDYYEDSFITVKKEYNYPLFLWQFVGDELFLFSTPDNHTSKCYINVQWRSEFDVIKPFKVFTDAIYMPNNKDLNEFIYQGCNMDFSPVYMESFNDIIVVPCQLEENDRYITFLVLYMSNQLIELNITDVNENGFTGFCFCDQLNQCNILLDCENRSDYFFKHTLDTMTYPLGALSSDLKHKEKGFCALCFNLYMNKLKEYGFFIENKKGEYITTNYYKMNPDFYKASRTYTLPDYLLPLRDKGEI